MRDRDGKEARRPPPLGAVPKLEDPHHIKVDV